MSCNRTAKRGKVAASLENLNQPAMAESFGQFTDLDLDCLLPFRRKGINLCYFFLNFRSLCIPLKFEKCFLCLTGNRLQIFIPDVHTLNIPAYISIICQCACICIAHFGKGDVHSGRKGSGNSISCPHPAPFHYGLHRLE